MKVKESSRLEKVFENCLNRKLMVSSVFPGGSEVKASACNVGDLGLIPGSGRSPGEGNGNVCLPGESHGWKSLVGYRPRGRKDSDTTERLHFHFIFSYAWFKSQSYHTSSLYTKVILINCLHLQIPHS